ncbi:MAG: DUF4209 domain-containing protein [Rhodospirillales bacterium]|nr:DUF4209 domain-containing protein [Rhodospirillales bacterium]
MSDEGKKKSKPISELSVNPEVFERESVSQIIDEVTVDSGAHYSSKFDNAAEAARAENLEDVADAFVFLAATTQAMLHSEDTGRPFRPMFEFEDRRGIIPDDFSDSQAEIWQRLAVLISDPVLKARLLDYSWLKLRKPELAEQAIGAYLEGAERFLKAAALEAKNHFYKLAAEHAERAVRLAFQASKNEALKQRASNFLCDIGPGLFKKGETAFIGTIERVVYSLGLGDSKVRAEFCQNAAEKSGREDPFRTKELWLQAADWFSRAKDPDGEERSRIAAAEIAVWLANLSASGDQPSFMTAASHLSEAIKIYRRVPGEQTRKEALRKLLNEYQDQMRDEMGEISTPIDLTEPAKWAEKQVSGLSFPEAIVRFALLHQPELPGKLREQVNEQAKENPLQYTISATISDKDGRTIDVVPSLFTENPKEAEKAILYHMMRHASMYHSWVGFGAVEAARRKIWEEHPVSLPDFIELARASALVPEGHETLFGNGLMTGFGGNYGIALHILTPQLENALRQILKQSGSNVSTKEKSDAVTQEAITLEKIIEHEKIHAIYGDAVQFDLKAVFTEKTTGGLRHDIAHGFIGDSGIKNAVSAYAFWLITHLIVLPLIAAGVEV